MKINQIHNLEQNIKGLNAAEAKGTDANQALPFQRTLSNLSAEQHQAYMTDLADKINAQGQLLTKKADIGQLQKYRQLIKEFVNQTVSNSFTFNKESAYQSRRRHKVYATVNTINIKLEELAKEVLKEQEDNIEILNKVDDIRGLILDLML